MRRGYVNCGTMRSTAMPRCERMGTVSTKSIRLFLIERGHDAAEVDPHEPETVMHFDHAKRVGTQFVQCEKCGPERGAEDAWPCRHLLGLAAQHADDPEFEQAWSLEDA